MSLYYQNNVKFNNFCFPFAFSDKWIRHQLLRMDFPNFKNVVDLENVFLLTQKEIDKRHTY